MVGDGLKQRPLVRFVCKDWLEQCSFAISGFCRARWFRGACRLNLCGKEKHGVTLMTVPRNRQHGAPTPLWIRHGDLDALNSVMGMVTKPPSFEAIALIR